MTSNQDIISWLTDILPNCKLTTDPNKVLTHPFFMASPSNISIVDHLNTKATTPNLKIVEERLNQLHLVDCPLSKIYLLLGDIGLDFTYHETTFLSLQEIETRYKVYCKHGQTDILDLAVTYHGMGHVNILTYSISEQTCFFRMDGGSNGYTRNDHWTYILNLKPVTLTPQQRYTVPDAFKQLLQPVHSIPLINFAH